MRRRLDPVATLVAQPEVLFLYEPTTGLYPRARMELWTVLDILVDRGTVTTLSDALRVYFGNPNTPTTPGDPWSIAPSRGLHAHLDRRYRRSLCSAGHLRLPALGPEVAVVADPRFELYEKAGWHWRLVDVNGRIVASSFRYASKASAKRAAQKAKDAAAVAQIVDARPAVEVTAVSGAAFGGQVEITIGGMGTIASPPTPAVTLVKAGGNQTKSAPKVKVGPGGLFLTSGVLQVATRGSVGPSGSATSTANVAEPDALGATLTANSVASTCTANETGATGSTTVQGGMLVLDESRIVPLPAAPAPNTTYEGTNADTGDTFTVILNEQVAGPGGITVTAVHIVLHGPTATGDILLARSESGVTTSSG